MLVYVKTPSLQEIMNKLLLAASTRIRQTGSRRKIRVSKSSDIKRHLREELILSTTDIKGVSGIG